LDNNRYSINAKLSNLEALLSEEDFIVDNSTAFQKSVPENVLDYAEI
jgi:hypothetical protein